MISDASKDFDILYEEICVLKSTDITEIKWLYLTTIKCQKLVAPIVHIT